MFFQKIFENIDEITEIIIWHISRGIYRHPYGKTLYDLD
ncbi:hypothetical protein NBRC3278_3344 [Acetobacter pasteurianus NBRC 3278]|jgi:hypothetical protein|uniref:Uncharacterized protein n=1 Tax=Acetobacter pasteurianus NBRC 3278 TaxID=1226660 RepID=A0A401X8M2_ACEPA|nr:hypothetical protein NBRC3222_2664 [Acetobacter pasteurianus NBRC 3222]GCD60666.1 hypothetical protein NBRC3277_3241 [Acetobacter pasteurianus NBRC 3277]GCD64251.1 hypothetical protein NBRC3278_3344 [Acetobacter pasteurianus NBRC 3278]GCD76451.1 hypothetical protein NBRC3299_2743 [Acetobacter pasteurianus NBRC 3299]